MPSLGVLIELLGLHESAAALCNANSLCLSSFLLVLLLFSLFPCFSSFLCSPFFCRFPPAPFPHVIRLISAVAISDIHCHQKALELTSGFRGEYLCLTAALWSVRSAYYERHKSGNLHLICIPVLLTVEITEGNLKKKFFVHNNFYLLRNWCLSANTPFKQAAGCSRCVTCWVAELSNRSSCKERELN